MYLSTKHKLLITLALTGLVQAAVWAALRALKNSSGTACTRSDPLEQQLPLL